MSKRKAPPLTGEVLDPEAKRKMTRAKGKELAATLPEDQTPLAFFERQMAMPIYPGIHPIAWSNILKARVRAAIDSLPYCHSRLESVEVEAEQKGQRFKFVVRKAIEHDAA